MMSMYLSKQFWFGALAAATVLLAAVMQNEHWFALAGIRPNLALVALIVLSFFIEDVALYCLLILLASIGLHFSPGLSREIVALALVALAGFFIKERAVWPGISGSAILLACGTFAVYAIVDAPYLYHNFTGALLESVYNVVLGLILFEIFSLYAKKTRFTI